MEEEQGIIRGESYECYWCGVTFAKMLYTIKRKSRYYCSADCNRAEDFFVFVTLSAFGFFASIIVLLMPIPEKIAVCFLSATIGFVSFLCALDNLKVRRRTPRGSRKEQFLENNVD